MLNGHFHWVQEYFPTFTAAMNAFRIAMPLMKWVEIAIIAGATAVATNVIAVAKIEERITAAAQVRENQIRNRDAQINRMEARDQRLEDRLNTLAADMATLKARLK